MSNKLRTLSVGVLALVAVGGFSQTKLQPTRTYKGPTPVIESTARFIPQISSARSADRPAVNNIFRRNFFNNDPINALVSGGVSSAVKTSSTPTASWPSIGATGWVPPDPDFAVGPNHVVTVVNSSIAIHKKDGTLQFQQTQEAFFNSVGAGSFVFDAKAFYDKVSGRFFVVTLDMDSASSQSFFDIAVSDDSDPNGNWFKYRISNLVEADSLKYWLDYPGWGHNKDAIVACGNMFGFTSGYRGCQVFVFKKSDFLAGAAPTISKFDMTNASSVQVMRTPDPSVDKVYMASVAGSGSMNIHAIENPGGAPTISSRTVTVPNFQNPGFYSNGPGGAVHDPLDGRLMNVYYRAGKLFLAHTVRNGSTQLNASRWYEIVLNNYPAGTPAYRQGGTLGMSGGSVWMPAIAVNKNEAIAVVSSRVTTSVAAEIVAHTRRKADTINQMGAPIRLRSSDSSRYTGGTRWGDYFGCTVDPVDDTTFWGYAMVYGPSGDWRTYVESFKVGTEASAAITSIAMYEGKSPVGTLANATTSNNQYYTVQSVAVARTGQVASVVYTATVPSSSPITLSTSVEGQAIAGVSLNFYAWNWTTGKYDFLSAGQLPSTDTTITANFPTNRAPYINASRQVKVLARAINPTNTIRVGAPFTLKVDMAQVSGFFD